MSLWTPVILILIISPLLIAAQIFSKKTNLKYLLFFIVYFLTINYLQLLIAKKIIILDFFNLETYWIGNILSLILSLAVILLNSKEVRQNIGFTTKFNKNTLKIGVLIFAGFLLFDFIFKMIIFPKNGEFNLEQTIFQATMPGLTEELLYRGIYLWLLGKAFIPTKTIKGVSFGWAFVIVTLLFGIAHGVAFTETYEFRFDFITIFYLTFISSLSLGVLRKFSGNLILPILGHNTINLMNLTIRLL